MKRQPPCPLAPDWRAVDLPEIDTLPSPVFCARSACRRDTVLPHTHRWRQLVYATAVCSILLPLCPSPFPFIPFPFYFIPSTTDSIPSINLKASIPPACGS